MAHRHGRQVKCQLRKLFPLILVVFIAAVSCSRREDAANTSASASPRDESRRAEAAGRPDGTPKPPVKPPAAIDVQPTSNGYVFANIPWGTQIDGVRQRLEAEGFNYEQQDGDGDHTFKGQVGTENCLVIAVMSNERLARESLSALPPKTEKLLRYIKK